MQFYAPMKPIMSAAQYRALAAVIGREGDSVVRYRDTRTVMTLIAMAKPARDWVKLVWGTVDGKRAITSATVTRPGRLAYEAETARRAAEAAHQARLNAA